MRSMKWVGCAAILALTIGSAQAETLTDALVSAYRNSNLLDQNEALLRAADEDVAIAVARLRPVINFVAESQYQYQVDKDVSGADPRDTFSAQAALTLDLTIFDFGRNRLAIDAAKETVLATREGLVDLEQNVLLTAVQAYVNVRLATEIVFLRQSNVRLISQELQAARDRFEVGDNTRTDVAQAESRLAQARANLASAEGDLMVAREAYRASTGSYPGDLAPLPRSPATAGSLDEARAVAVRTHPSIRQGQREVLIAKINVARAGADTRPTISGQAQTALSDSDLETTSNFGRGTLTGTNSLSLTFNQTLYSGGQLAATYRRALASQEASQASLLQDTVDVEEDVGNAWSNLIVADAQIEATDRQITAAQIAFDGLREEAKLGARTALDVLDAEQELLDARVSRATAVATRDLGVYSLLQAMGLLTVDHLQLGIPSYDPAAYYRAVKDAPVHTIQGKKLERILKSIGRD